MTMMGPALTPGAEPEEQIYAQEEGPEDGHTFRIGADVRGSIKIFGEDLPPHDAEEFDALPQFVEVRAWNIRDALRKAADLPLSAWFGMEEDDDADAR